MKRSLFCTGISLAIWVQSVAGAAGQYLTNYWTGTTVGYWEEALWSLGERPSTNHTVVFNNAGDKTLAIGRNTALQFPQTLSIQQLEVDAPAGSRNRLLLDSAGLETPLRVTYELVVGTNASFASLNSALATETLAASGPCTIVGGTSRIVRVMLGVAAPAQLTLSNTMLAASRFVAGPQNLFSPRNTPFSATVDQFGGTNTLGGGQYAFGLHLNGDSTYHLHDGVLSAGSASLQAYGNRTGFSRLIVSGGYADLGAVLFGDRSGVPNAGILFERGQFRATQIHTMGGTFTQTGGTSIVGDLRFPSLDQGRGEYFLSAGALVSSNFTLGSPMEARGLFVQSGGVHSNLYMELRGHNRQGDVSPLGQYEMRGGLFVSGTIAFIGGSFSQSEGVSHVTNIFSWGDGQILLSGGSLYCRTNSDVPVIQTGGLHVVSDLLKVKSYSLLSGTLVAPHIVVWPGTLLLAGDVTNANSLTLIDSTLRARGRYALGTLSAIGRATLDLESVGSVHFRGADAWPEYSRLRIRNWSRGTGRRVVFGDDASSLAASQVEQITFENPAAFPPGTYPAKILADGEVVPDVPPIAFTRVGASLSLSWKGSLILYSSTNVAGPFVAITPGPTNLYETTLSGAQRFFLLKPGN